MKGKAFAAIFLMVASSASYASTVQFDVYANANSSGGSGTGLETGLSYNAGETINGYVDPDDLWNAGPLPRWSNADGLIAPLYATGSDESGMLAGVQIGSAFSLFSQYGLTAPYGSLVGSIGNTYFLLGTDFSVAAPETGELNLFYWDSNSSDNTQFVTAYIKQDVSAIPLPAAFWLMGSGLAGLIGLGRRKATV